VFDIWLGRVGTTEDVAGTVICLCLCSLAEAHITDAVIPLTGGLEFALKTEPVPEASTRPFSRALTKHSYSVWDLSGKTLTNLSRSCRLRAIDLDEFNKLVVIRPPTNLGVRGSNPFGRAILFQ
jgi:hypothetical protein